MWSLDHFFPKSKGGKRGKNLIFCCSNCNTIKADRTPEELIKWLEDKLDSQAKYFYFSNREIRREIYENILRNIKQLKLIKTEEEYESSVSDMKKI